MCRTLNRYQTSSIYFNCFAGGDWIFAIYHTWSNGIAIEANKTTYAFNFDCDGCGEGYWTTWRKHCFVINHDHRFKVK